MTTVSRDRRRIDPGRGPRLGDGSPNDNDRGEIGPTQIAFREWEAAGLALPDLAGMRTFRWRRLTAHIVARGYAGLLMFDPLNIRYATDTTNMALWNTHNPFRACLLCPDGHMVLWDYERAPFLADHTPLVAEVRTGAGMFYFATGDRGAEVARDFAGQVAEIVSTHAGSETRLGVDKIMLHGLRALEAAGFEVMEGEEVTEKARAVKGPDEIRAMRCAVHACERAVAEMQAACRPGISEAEIWSVLHAGNIRRGGEWIETRLLASGPRTNPWFRECGPRVVQPNEIVAFDTDLIGTYGICVDLSRTWWVGERSTPRPDMRAAMHHAQEHLTTNLDLLRPGTPLRDLSFGGHHLHERFQKQKYGCKFHGVGLCDEWPHIDYPDVWVEGALDYVLEPGMVLCVEALVSPERGDFSIKLEDQVLVTEDGPERLTAYPFDAALTGGG